jgi:hypothetical protein
VVVVVRPTGQGDLWGQDRRLQNCRPAVFFNANWILLVCQTAPLEL